MIFRKGNNKSKNRLHIHFRRCVVLMLCFVVFLTIGTTTEAKKQDQAARVLFISSYSYSWPTVPLQIQGLKNTLGESVQLDIEFMDTKNRSDQESMASLKTYLQHKIDGVNTYDAVVAGDDAALHFVDENYDQMFRNIPIVFEAVNDISYAKKLGKTGHFTGVVEQISYKENIEFANKIQPEANKILAIADDTITGKAEQKQFLDMKKEYPQYSFEVLNASRLSMNEIQNKIASLDQKTILLYLILSEDKQGNVYSNAQVCTMLESKSPVPVYRFVQAGIGEGVLGGNIVLHEKSGEIAGKMVRKILSGTKISQIPVQTKSPNGYYIDEYIMNKYNISTSLIPSNATVINHQQTFTERHGKVVGMAVVIGGIILAFGILSTRNMMEKKRKAQLAEKNGELEEALHLAQQADESKGRFLAQTSHEIRTPLNIVIGLTEMAMDETDRTGKVYDYLTKIESSSRVLLGLINNILDMSAISDGKMEIEHTKFDFQEQLTDLSMMFYQQCQKKNIRFDIHLKGVTEEYLIGDSLRLNQILINILGNSVKFTQAGGTVSLSVVQASTSRNRVHMRFIIKDTGCGMSEDMLKRLFKPFEQQDSSTARKHGGSGLGMAITKNLLTMMEGSVKVDSEPGKGTEFVVDIPFTRAEEGERKMISNMFTEYRALVVADCEESCHERGFCLEDMGLSYDIATEADTALDMIGQAEDEHRPYKICVIDWRLSAEGGEALIRDIREIFGNEIMIIGAAFDLSAVTESGMKAGANYMVGKPVFRSTLFDAMMRVSEGKISQYSDEKKEVNVDFTGKKVLIAEDIALNMEVAVNLFKKVGMQAICVENGQEAIDAFCKKPEGFFDVIFLDINMPVMDGYGAARGIRSSGKADAKTVPIYAMTANAFTSDVAEALDAGMDGHIAKPVERDVLYKTLANLFDKDE